MRLSVFYHHIASAAEQHKLPLNEVLREVHNLGIDYVEIDLGDLKKSRADILRGLDDAGLRISCIYAFEHFDIDPHSGRELVDMAKECRSLAVMPIPGQLSQDDSAQMWNVPEDRFTDWLDQSEQVQNMILGEREVAALADGQLKVCLEDFDAVTAPFATVNGLKYFLDRVPGLGLAFDTGNFAFMDEDVLQAFDEIGGRTVHVHLKDRGVQDGYEGKRYCRGLAPVAVGSGYIPIRQILAKLSSYSGILAIEHFGMEDQLQGIRDSVKFLRSV